LLAIELWPKQVVRLRRLSFKDSNNSQMRKRGSQTTLPLAGQEISSVDVSRYDITTSPQRKQGIPLFCPSLARRASVGSKPKHHLYLRRHVKYPVAHRAAVARKTGTGKVCEYEVNSPLAFSWFSDENLWISVDALAQKPLRDAILVKQTSKNLGHEFHEYLRERVRWKTVALRLLFGLCVLVAVVWFGRHAAHEIKSMETWIAGQGVWGWVVFVGIAIVFTSMFVPQTLIAVAAGAVFGIFLGTVLVVVGAILTAAINYLIAHSMLRPWVERLLERHPKLQAIQDAAEQKGLRLQLLLRLAPINSVSVSYVLGASGVLFSTFLIATLALIPGLFVNVYVGYMASHVTKAAGGVSEHSTLHTVAIVGGLVVCIGVMIGIGRVAAKSIANAQDDS